MKSVAGRFGVARSAVLVVIACLVGVGIVVLVTLFAVRGTGSPPAAAVVATRPPMGWNSWDADGCGVDEHSVERAADALVTTGLRAAGYRYVVLDDCWVAPHRDANGRLYADPTRFPDGIAAVAAYVHARGLLFGVYSSATDMTCAQRTHLYPGATGSEGHETLDAATFAAWRVDLLKYDWCSPDPSRQRQLRDFTAMQAALRSAGRPIVYAINPNSRLTGIVPGAVYDWSRIGSTTRIASDTDPTWVMPTSVHTGHIGVLDTIDAAIPLRGRNGPGHWNDLDALGAGIGGAGAEAPGLTAAEQRTQFGLWSMLSAPLFTGTDPRTTPASVVSMLADREVIAVDQDPATHQPWINETGTVWAKPLTDGSFAVALVNRRDMAATITACLTGPAPTIATAVALPNNRTYRVTDLWTGDGSTGDAAITRTVAPHDTALFRVTPLP